MNIEAFPLPTYTVLNIQVGRIQTRLDAQGCPWTTAIYKERVIDSIEAAMTGLVGDEHTGERIDFDRAICCHSIAHYRFWSAYFRRPFPIGIFGENLTLDGGLDEDLCIGDIFQCGTAIFQVTQPRTPCYKQAKRLEIPQFVKLIEQTNRRGFLLRVLEPGIIQSGQSFTMIERPYPDASLIYVNRKFFEKDDPEAISWLAHLAPLAHDWRAKAAARAGVKL